VTEKNFLKNANKKDKFLAVSFLIASFCTASYFTTTPIFKSIYEISTHGSRNATWTMPVKSSLVNTLTDGEKRGENSSTIKKLLRN
jgi:hypothetical protein